MLSSRKRNFERCTESFTFTYHPKFCKDIKIQSQYFILWKNSFFVQKKQLYLKFVSKLSFEQTTGLLFS